MNVKARQPVEVMSIFELAEERREIQEAIYELQARKRRVEEQAVRELVEQEAWPLLSVNWRRIERDARRQRG